MPCVSLHKDSGTSLVGNNDNEETPHREEGGAGLRSSFRSALAGESQASTQWLSSFLLEPGRIATETPCTAQGREPGLRSYACPGDEPRERAAAPLKESHTNGARCRPARTLQTFPPGLRHLRLRVSLVHSSCCSHVVPGLNLGVSSLCPCRGPGHMLSFQPLACPLLSGSQQLLRLILQSSSHAVKCHLRTPRRTGIIYLPGA